MAKAREDAGTDSFELMLDTICNVFGGIILMAILVIVQTQATAGRIRANEASAQDTLLKERELWSDAKTLAGRVIQLKEESASLQETYLATASSNTDMLIRRRREFQDAVTQAEVRLEEAGKQRPEKESKLKNDQVRLRKLAREIRITREGIERAKQQMRIPKKLTHKKIRLPILHTAKAATQMNFLIRKDGIYLLRDPEHCTRTHVSGNYYRFEPRPGAGFQMSKDGAVPARFLATLRTYNPRTHYISFWVSGTNRSFASFQTLRALVTNKGYEYSVYPYGPARGLILLIGKGMPVQ